MLVRFDSPRVCQDMMENFFESDTMPNRSSEPSMDIIEQENEIVVSVELPGIKKEDVKITFEKNVLTVSGERKPIEVSEKEKVLLKENQSENFSRSVKLGFEIDSSKIAAEMSNGILTITLPKTEAVKAREISIN
jgi:HSP20 family protein